MGKISQIQYHIEFTKLSTFFSTGVNI